MKTIGVASGKGGVGKTNLTVNLGIALAKRGERVLMMDADIGLANLDVVIGTQAKYSIQHVLRGLCTLQEAITEGPGGVHFLSGVSGLEALIDLDSQSGMQFMQDLMKLERQYDYLLLDTGAGLSQNLLTLLGISDRVLLVITPDPSSLSDGYAVLKAHQLHSPHIGVDIVMNMVENHAQGKAFYYRIQTIANQYLRAQTEHLGSVRFDAQAMKLNRERKPFVMAQPSTDAARDVEAIADALLGNEVKQADNQGFGARFFALFARQKVA